MTGLTTSPELFLVAQNLGEEEVLRRVRALTRSDASAAYKTIADYSRQFMRLSFNTVSSTM